MSNAQDLQNMADSARKAEDIIEASKDAAKVLETTQVQIKNAQGVLALTNFGVGKKVEELEKVKKDFVETMKIEKDKLVETQTKRQGAEKEFGEFLTSVHEEKKTI